MYFTVIEWIFMIFVQGQTRFEDYFPSKVDTWMSNYSGTKADTKFNNYAQ